jgi:hypothetical protein
MVKKTYTYAFNDLLRFIKNNLPLDKILDNIEQFTKAEKQLLLDISSIVPNPTIQGRVESFKSTKSIGKPIIEIPKGHSNNNQENHLDTAIREFVEETGISEKEIDIIKCENPIAYIIKDNDVIYISYYYIARLKKNIHVNEDRVNETSEICEVLTVSLHTIENYLTKNKPSQYKYPEFTYEN